MSIEDYDDPPIHAQLQRALGDGWREKLAAFQASEQARQLPAVPSVARPQPADRLAYTLAQLQDIGRKGLPALVINQGEKSVWMVRDENPRNLSGFTLQWRATDDPPEGAPRPKPADGWRCRCGHCYEAHRHTNFNGRCSTCDCDGFVDGPASAEAAGVRPPLDSQNQQAPSDAAPFVDTPLKQAIRSAFDNPTIANIEAVAAASASRLGADPLQEKAEEGDARVAEERLPAGQDLPRKTSTS